MKSIKFKFPYDLSLLQDVIEAYDLTYFEVINKELKIVEFIGEVRDLEKLRLDCQKVGKK